MVESDWGDWLLRAVDAATPETTAVWYLGCNGFVLTTGETTVYVDPYLGTGDPPRTVRMVPVPFTPGDVGTCDALFVTHEHTDHVHGPSQAPILANTGANLYAPDASLSVIEDEGWTDDPDPNVDEQGVCGVDPDQIQQVSEGDSVAVGEMTVHVEPANDPDADHPVAYVFETPGGTFFHGGDARPGEAFERVGREYDLDVGALAFGSEGTVPDKKTGEPRVTKWYSNENEVVEAARQLRLDRFLPTHWDVWKGLTADPTALFEHVRSFEFPRRLEVIEIGDSIEL